MGESVMDGQLEAAMNEVDRRALKVRDENEQKWEDVCPHRSKYLQPQKKSSTNKIPGKHVFSAFGVGTVVLCL